MIAVPSNTIVVYSEMVHRADVECFTRALETRGRARDRGAPAVHGAGFYRYAEQEGMPERSPAAHVRRPRLDNEIHGTGLDRNEMGAMLAATGLASADEHALVLLLAITGRGCPKHSVPTSRRPTGSHDERPSQLATGRRSCPKARCGAPRLVARPRAAVPWPRAFAPTMGNGLTPIDGAVAPHEQEGGCVGSTES